MIFLDDSGCWLIANDIRGDEVKSPAKRLEVEVDWIIMIDLIYNMASRCLLHCKYESKVGS